LNREVKLESLGMGPALAEIYWRIEISAPETPAQST